MSRVLICDTSSDPKPKTKTKTARPTPERRAQMVWQCSRAVSDWTDLFKMRCLKVHSHEDIMAARLAAEEGRGWDGPTEGTDS